jgi:hypothetical protein
MPQTANKTEPTLRRDVRRSKLFLENAAVGL